MNTYLAHNSNYATAWNNNHAPQYERNLYQESKIPMPLPYPPLPAWKEEYRQYIIGDLRKMNPRFEGDIPCLLGDIVFPLPSEAGASMSLKCVVYFRADDRVQIGTEPMVYARVGDGAAIIVRSLHPSEEPHLSINGDWLREGQGDPSKRRETQIPSMRRQGRWE